MDFGIGDTGPGQLHFRYFYKKEDMQLEPVIERPASRVANKVKVKPSPVIERSGKLHADREARMARFLEMVKNNEAYADIHAELAVTDNTLFRYAKHLRISEEFEVIWSKRFL